MRDGASFIRLPAQMLQEKYIQASISHGFILFEHSSRFAVRSWHAGIKENHFCTNAPSFSNFSNCCCIFSFLGWSRYYGPRNRLKNFSSRETSSAFVFSSGNRIGYSGTAIIVMSEFGRAIRTGPSAQLLTLDLCSP